jgi:hypothetical protein
MYFFLAGQPRGGRRRENTWMNEKYRIAIAEDHTILREGLLAILISEPDFEVVYEAGNGRNTIHSIANQGSAI